MSGINRLARARVCRDNLRRLERCVTDFDPVRLGNLASRPERPSEMARLARVCARLTDILQGAVNRRAPLVNGQIRPEEYTQRVLMSTAVSVDAAAMAREFDRAAREKKRKADR